MKWFKKKKEKEIINTTLRFKEITVREIIDKNFKYEGLKVYRDKGTLFYNHIESMIHDSRYTVDGTISPILHLQRDLVFLNLASLSFCMKHDPLIGVAIDIKKMLNTINSGFFEFIEKTSGDEIRSMLDDKGLLSDKNKKVLILMIDSLFDDYFILYNLEEKKSKVEEEELLRQEEIRTLEEIQYAHNKARELLSSYNNSEFKSKLNEFKNDNN